MSNCPKCGKLIETKGRCQCGKCLCDECLIWGPKYQRIRDVLGGTLRRDFEELHDHLYMEAFYGNIAEAKLDGSWPGWEWIIKEKAKRGLK